MTNEPTPETDDFRPCPLTPSDWPAFARAMEIQRNAARAERDELNRQLSVALKGKRPYSAEFADETIAAQVKRIAELEEKLNGWFSERGALRADVALITAENERLATGNHSMEKEIPELRHALEKARADVARLSTALEGIAEYGKLCNDGDATDCARLIYLAKLALAK
jgi:chromosome segregation ATPase